MGVICFGSLKGGVGKTSLSVNVAHAYAERGCEVLIVDLDPMGHASRLFLSGQEAGGVEQSQALSVESPLARLFLASESGAAAAGNISNITERCVQQNITLLRPVREQLSLIPSGPELRHFLWGRGARLFKDYFSDLIKELSSDFDHIIIDTPPDFNVLTRNALASADIIVVPVDSSAMSVHCLEEIVTSANHIQGPTWAIVRSMVTKQASRMHRLTSDLLEESARKQENSMVRLGGAAEGASEIEDISDPEDFISLVERKGRDRSPGQELEEEEQTIADRSPIFLLHSVIYRSEQQNKLSFMGRTAFDHKANSPLKEQYLSVSRELEALLSLSAKADPALEMENEFPLSGLRA